MSGAALLAGILVLALGTSPTLSQDALPAACRDGVQACTSQMMGSIGSSGGCSAITGFMECVKRTGCALPEAQMSSMLQNMMATLKTQGIECDLSGHGSGSGSGSHMGGTGPGGAGPDTGAGFDMAGIEDCTNGLTICTNSMMTAMQNAQLAQGPCKTVQDFVDCIFALDCPIPESQKQHMVDQTLIPMKEQGMDCDIKTGTNSSSAAGSGTAGTGSKTGSETGTPYETGVDTNAGDDTDTETETFIETGNFVLLLQVKALFASHGCNQTFEGCAQKVSGDKKQPECGDIKKSGQCMFKECTAIKGTEDEKKVAKLLAQFASKQSDCEIKAEELMGDNNRGAALTPVWSSLMLLAATALLKTVLF